MSSAAQSTGSTPGLRRLARVRARLWREYVFCDEWAVAAPRDAVFATLADAGSYPLWWRPVYLSVQADGPARLGGVAQQRFKGRLPYRLRTRSRIVRFEPPGVIEATVDGDLRGRGRWTLSDSRQGTWVRFDWTVFADRRLLRWLTPVLRPLFARNHAWAVARAIDGLEPFVRDRGGAGEPAERAQ